MKILFISDLHFHNYKPFSSIIDGENSRLLDVYNSVKEAVKIADKNGCSYIIVAGDVFHTRGNLKPSVIAKAKEVFTDINQTVYLLAGNHDMESFCGGKTALEVFKGMLNVHVIEEPDYYTTYFHFDFIAIPYIHDTAEFKAIYQNLIDNHDSKFAVIHQGIDDFAEGLPETTLTTTWLANTGKIDVFTGHYHKPMNKLNQDSNIIQIGAVCQHSFSDIGQDRGCWIYDVKERDCKFIPINIAPKFIEIENLKDIDNLKGNFIRIKSDSDSKVKKISEKLSELNIPYSVKLEREFITAHSNAISLNKPVVMLSEYIDLQDDLKPFKSQITALFEELQ